MSLKSFLDRYGLPLGVIAVFALVLVLLPGNSDDSELATASGGEESDGSGDFGSGTGSGTGSGRNPLGSGSGSGSGSGLGTGGGGGSGGGSTGSGPGSGGPTVGGGGDPGSVGSVAFGQGPSCDATGRQKGFSEYLPPCADWVPGTPNGGATARGVFPDKIIVAVWYGQEDPATRQALAGARLSDPPATAERVWDTMRRYSNAHFETYGREVQFVRVDASGPSDSIEAMKADALKIAEEVGAFAAVTGNALAGIPNVMGRELAQRGVVCICTTSLSSEFYTELPPMLWSALPTADDYALHSAEYISKRMGFEPAEYAGVGSVGLPRVYCLMYLTGAGETVDPEGPRIANVFRQAFAARGLSFKTEIAYFYDPGSNQNDVTAMITKFKSEGCTTLVPLVDPIMPILITREATNQQYFPEWFIVGTGLSDTTTIARFYDQQQWSHAFGISPLWVTWDVVENSAGYNEYHHMRPDDDKGDEGVLINVYRSLFQSLWTGIHMAGPNLTPETFAQGMYSYPPTGGTPSTPLVFRTREFPTEIKDFTEVWYDPNQVGPDERSDVGPGMIVKAEGGKRYDLGEWPQQPPSRSNGVTVTAAVNTRLEHDDDGHTHTTRCLSCPD